MTIKRISHPTALIEPVVPTTQISTKISSTTVLSHSPILNKIASYCPLDVGVSILCASRGTRNVRREFLKQRGNIVGHLLLHHHTTQMPAALQADLVAVASSITSLTFDFQETFKDQTQQSYLLERAAFFTQYKSTKKATYSFPSLHKFQEISTLFTRVTAIHLKGKYISDRVVSDIVTAFPHLQNFSISDSKQLTSDATFKIHTSLQNLSILALIDCPQLFETNHTYFIGTSIVNYTIIRCGTLTSRMLGYAPSLRNLKYLTTSHFYNIDNVFFSFRAAMPGLQTKNIDEGNWLIHAIPDAITGTTKKIVNKINSLHLEYRFSTAAESAFYALLPLIQFVYKRCLNLIQIHSVAKSVVQAGLSQIYSKIRSL